jgi:hypothetical protein
MALVVYTGGGDGVVNDDLPAVKAYKDNAKCSYVGLVVSSYNSFSFVCFGL